MWDKHPSKVKSEELKTHTFVKTIGTDNKPSMPWLATQVVKDNMIKANETRVISKEKELSSFTLLKRGYFKVP